MADVTRKIVIAPLTQENVARWLEADCVDEKTKVEIRYLQETDPNELSDAFYTHLSFGTGGLRGIMGIGTNRMNIYTVRAATQGLANYIHQQNLTKTPSVAISYDSRHFSRTFAEEAAKVLAGNHIVSFLFEELRPTPLLSFAVREKQCIAGIMITASHNAAKYNGYTVYWEDGAQVLPPHDVGIIAEVEKIRNLDQIQWIDTIQDPSIHHLGEEIDAQYLDAVRSLQLAPETNQNHGHELSIIYTGLHGTGITLVPKILKDWGFTSYHPLEQQNIPDGDFPTVRLPNPEYREALEQGITALREQEADILIATDPDADRMGLVIRHCGDAVQLSGNQIVCLFLDYICRKKTQQENFPKDVAFIKTVVTTELFQSICDSYHRLCFNVLTGFKYIAARIRQWENEPHEHTFLFGGEESYGYLYGTHARDKDAIICSALAAEMALDAKREGKTLVDRMEEIYLAHGIYVDQLSSFDFPETKEGREAMQSVMRRLREEAPETILHTPVVAMEDYQTGIRTFLQTRKTQTIKLPKTDMLVYWLEDGTKLVLRPSGTEPKVKLYCGIVVKVFNDVEEGYKKGTRRAQDMINAFRSLLEKQP